MATYNIGSTGVANPGVAWLGQNKVGVITIPVDLSRRLGPNVPVAGYAAADVLQVADLPIGIHFLYGALNVQTVEGAAGTAALAVTGTAITLLAATSVNALGFTVFTGAPTFIAAASIVTVTLGGTLLNAGTAKFTLSLFVSNYAS